jgi:hypothetical protein
MLAMYNRPTVDAPSRVTPVQREIAGSVAPMSIVGGSSTTAQTAARSSTPE